MINWRAGADAGFLSGGGIGSRRQRRRGRADSSEGVGSGEGTAPLQKIF